MSRRAEPGPSLLVVAAGGIGVLVVLAFVIAVGFGGTTQPTPGELVRVVRDDGPGGMAVLAGRCLDQRVRSVTVREGDEVRWAVASRKGSIERRYVVGGEAPLGFEVSQPLDVRPTGMVRAEVTFVEDGQESTDARSVDVAELLEEGDALEVGAPACGGDEGPGGVAVAFAVAALVVVAGYIGMLLRARRR